MRDFTLIIPTCNGAQRLAALLSYLESEKAKCLVLVLDSSDAEVLAGNRARVKRLKLDVEIVECPGLETGEKYRQGLHKVATAFCAFCSEGDVVILEGLRRCLDALRDNQTAPAAQGHSFSFLARRDGDFELSDLGNFTASMGGASPVERLGRLFQNYRTASHGIFRTSALQRIFAALDPMSTGFGRDLAWSALALIEGQPILMSDVTYGRGLDVANAAEHPGPLECFCTDPDGLIAEYLRYRELLVAALMRRPDNELERDEIRDLLNIIHLRYFAQHASDSVLEFVTRQEIAGIHFAEYWPRRKVNSPFHEAAGQHTPQAAAPITMRGRERRYLVFPTFYAPPKAASPQLDVIVHLIDVLDVYRPSFDVERNAGGCTI
jgi:glycosyltransferase domain-containing protein